MTSETGDGFRISSSQPSEQDGPVNWTVALAGGEGARFKTYVERRLGRQIPSQYCPLLGARSMLQHTLARLNQVTPASRTLTVIGTDHMPMAMAQIAGASDHVFRQPSSRDTGVALYVALAMIKRWSPNAIVTVTPTTHYVAPAARYLQSVEAAQRVAARLENAVVVLGARPSEPDPDLSYLELGERLTDSPEAIRVEGVVENPSVARAQKLIARGALWNTMVVCGSVNAFWSLGRARPHLMDVLDCLVPLVGTVDESDALDYIYRAYRPVSFSTDILKHAASRAAVIELDDVVWSDWGQPERVETVLALRRARLGPRVSELH